MIYIWLSLNDHRRKIEKDNVQFNYRTNAQWGEMFSRGPLLFPRPSVSTSYSIVGLVLYDYKHLVNDGA